MGSEESNLGEILHEFVGSGEGKGVEQSLRESEERYRTLFMQLDEAAVLHEIIYDLYHYPIDYIFKECNPKFESMFNVRREQVVGQKATVFYGKKDIPLLELFSQAVTTRKPLKIEIYHEPSRKYLTATVFSPQERYAWALFSDETELKSYEEQLKGVKTEVASHIKECLQELDELSRHLHQETAERKRAEEAHKRTEKMYRLIASNIPNGAVFLFDKNLRYSIAEGAGLATMGFSKEALEGKSIWEVCPADVCTILEPHYRAALAGKEDIFEVVLYNRIYVFHTLPIRDENGTIVSGMLMAQEITSRKRLEMALKESEELFRTMAENSLTGVVLYRKKFLYVNPTIMKITGYSKEELMNMYVWEVVHPDFRETTRQVVERRLRGERFATYSETKFLTKEGKERWAQVYANTVKYRGQYAGLVNLVDITDKKKLEEELKWAATTDKLTGIMNRQSFEKALDDEVKRAQRYKVPLSLIMFDLDRFKRVNDLYGHQTGDRMLQSIASLVKQNIRTTDVIGRWGGEEFMILASDTELEKARELAEKLRSLVADHRFETVGTMTVSFGVAQFKEDDTMESLFKRVDEVLYRAKRRGRNRVEVALLDYF